jgi:hypothetical protein
VQALQAAHEAFKADFHVHQKTHDDLAAIQASLAELGATENPYSTQPFEVRRTLYMALLRFRYACIHVPHLKATQNFNYFPPV